LEQSSTKYQRLIDSLPDAFARHRIVTNEQGQAVDYIFLEANSVFEDMTGLKIGDIIGKKVTEAIPGIVKTNFDWIATYGNVALNRETISLVQYSEPLNRWYEVYAFSTEHGYFETIFRDVTELHKTHNMLRESEKRCNATFKALPDLLFIFSQDGTFLDYHANEEASLIALPEYFTGKSLAEVLPEALSKQVMQNLKALCETGEMQTLEYSLEFDSGRKYYEALFSKLDDKRILSVIRDITRRKIAEINIEENVQIYRTALVGIIESMGRMLEKRDPYTASHQQRVSDLAVAIAELMGLGPDQVEGIKLAARVHDIGKIEVPAEILSRPGKLSSLELEIIRQHPRAGFEILGNIDFPWPIAATVKQHHEKMNGSGYPEGLSGEEILLEARIICVADVVEAMASHRPYRPSLGIERAIEEIVKHRGTCYDSAVVDACVNLFNRQGYSFQTTESVPVGYHSQPPIG
jgi:putative nucleotidyltransferase with HDIG domain